MCLSETKENILYNQSNRSVLEYLKLSENTEYFSRWSDSGYDEGAQVLVNEYCEFVPSEAYFSFGVYNLVVSPQNSTIFGFQFGRFTFFVRPDFDYHGIPIGKPARKLSTLDGDIDISSLGNKWVLLSSVAEEGEENLCYKQAYYWANKHNKALHRTNR